MIEESSLVEVEVKSNEACEASSLYKEIISAYEAEEERVPVEYVHNKVTYMSPVNFRESMKTPRHRWFPYKEGFSPSFVQTFLKENAPENAKTVLDPFCGVGTTLLECSRLGLNAFGFEVSPMSHFVAETKAASLNNLELNEFNNWIEIFRNSELKQISCPPDNDTVISYFEPTYLEALLRLKAFYNSIENSKIKAIFKLTFLNCLEQFSTHRKAGNGVKRKTKYTYQSSAESPIDQIRIAVLHDLEKIETDLALEPQIKPFAITRGSCLDATLYPKNIAFDAVLTSPPYANCFDYSKIYMVELWLGDFFKDKQSQKDFRADSLRSHVHARWNSRHDNYGNDLVDNQIFKFLSMQKLWTNQIPTMLSGYFADMGYLLHLIASKCNKGAAIGLVVGNSYYGSLPVATDMLLCMLGRQFGLEPVKVNVYRNIIASSQQFTRAVDRKYMRESLVVLKKK